MAQNTDPSALIIQGELHPMSDLPGRADWTKSVRNVARRCLVVDAADRLSFEQVSVEMRARLAKGADDTCEDDMEEEKAQASGKSRDRRTTLHPRY